MIESWREWLYPLGFLAQVAFVGRFMQQWIMSELQQKSVVTRSFWQLSLTGNALLLIHAILQIQFHVCLIQVTNGCIAWRNLNLMKERSKQVKLRTVVFFMIASVCAVFALFFLQSYLLADSYSWFRLPIWWGHSAQNVGVFWHLIGSAGLLLFSSRFWIQWWYAEKEDRSSLGAPFWWLSLIGGVLSLLYFVRIEDPVNGIGPALGLIPYIRNLMIMKTPSSVGSV